jgi:hypothetical protein
VAHFVEDPLHRRYTQSAIFLLRETASKSSWNIAADLLDFQCPVERSSVVMEPQGLGALNRTL